MLLPLCLKSWLLFLSSTAGAAALCVKEWAVWRLLGGGETKDWQQSRPGEDTGALGVLLKLPGQEKLNSQEYIRSKETMLSLHLQWYHFTASGYSLLSWRETAQPYPWSIKQDWFCTMKLQQWYRVVLYSAHIRHCLSGLYLLLPVKPLAFLLVRGLETDKWRGIFNHQLKRWGA